MINQIGNYYLYCHIRLDKNEPFYIGIGTKTKRRTTRLSAMYARAYTDNKRGVMWKKIVKKAGYKIEILLESDNYDFIKKKEIEFIALYGRIDTKTGTLANHTEGGDGTVGSKWNEAQYKAKKKRNNDPKEIYRAKYNNPAAKQSIHIETGTIFVTLAEGCRHFSLDYRIEKGRVYRGLICRAFDYVAGNPTPTNYKYYDEITGNKYLSKAHACRELGLEYKKEQKLWEKEKSRLKILKTDLYVAA